ncbi:sulfatase family protein [Rubinisphaera margarita]|uniref:sulfatase family protein n=1 Tax=Rubinisphaera margarita TaxID=2909586 RepID=UPI001EE88288|nr:sulfatase [Rubinisphaera margarita]MCG6154668.1 sulfatase [Rubinisphaera margarita]
MFLFTRALCATLLLAFVLSCSLEAAQKNVVLFIADDHGFQIGAYGDKVAKSPGLDRLAAEGTKFTRAYATTASCSASRSVIMSGLQNHATGHYGHAHGYNHFSTYQTVVPLTQHLDKAGYRTCSIGKYHLAPRDVYYFESYENGGIKGGSRNPVGMAENAAKWIKQNDDRPFFLYFCTSDPHRGGGPGNFANFNNRDNPYPETERNLFKPEDMNVPDWLPDTQEVKEELAEYYQACNRVDQGVQRLYEILEETGHLDDTLFIFTSDNGPPFPGAKTNLYQPGANLPFIVRHPDQKKRGMTTDAVINWTDITPTILDFCEVTPGKYPPVQPGENDQPIRRKNEVQYKFHGRSFLPILEQEHPEGWDSTFLSHTFHEITMYYPMRVAIDGDYKLIFNIAHQLPYPNASDLFASPTWQSALKREEKTFGQKTIYDYENRPRFELYNIAEDPYEGKNLALDPEHQDKLKELQEKLQAWQKETKDPWELKWRYE